MISLCAIMANASSHSQRRHFGLLPDTASHNLQPQGGRAMLDTYAMLNPDQVNL
jgi:hypothetical protein